MKRFPLLVLAVALLVLTSGSPGASLPQQTAPVDPISPALQDDLDRLGPGEMIGVVVTLSDQVDLKALPGSTRASRLRALVLTLKGKAAGTQGPIIGLLASGQARGEVSGITPLWIFNGLAVTATADIVYELAARPEVLRITPDEAIAAPAGPRSRRATRATRSSGCSSTWPRSIPR